MLFLTLACPSCKPVCVSVLPGDQIFPGETWVWRAVTQIQLQALWHRISSDGNWKGILPCCSSVLVSKGSGRVPLSRIGSITSAHRHVSTPGRLTLSWWYLCMECCGTGSALGADLEIHFFIPALIPFLTVIESIPPLLLHTTNIMASLSNYCHVPPSLQPRYEILNTYCFF